jgi:HAMP domain-containing protein
MEVVSVKKYFTSDEGTLDDLQNFIDNKYTKKRLIFRIVAAVAVLSFGISLLFPFAVFEKIMNLDAFWLAIGALIFLIILVFLIFSDLFMWRAQLVDIRRMDGLKSFLDLPQNIAYIDAEFYAVRIGDYIDSLRSFEFKKKRLVGTSIDDLTSKQNDFLKSHEQGNLPGQILIENITEIRAVNHECYIEIAYKAFKSEKGYEDQEVVEIINWFTDISENKLKITL